MPFGAQGRLHGVAATPDGLRWLRETLAPPHARGATATATLLYRQRAATAFAPSTPSAPTTTQTTPAAAVGQAAAAEDPLAALKWGGGGGGGSAGSAVAGAADPLLPDGDVVAVNLR
jgi:hypothetical protein